MTLRVLILLMLMLACSTAASPEDTIDFLSMRQIPVQDLAEENGRTVITYDLVGADDPDAVERDLGYIFGKAAKDYPDSKEIEIRCIAGDETMFTYVAKTADVVDYAEGRSSSLAYKSGSKEPASNEDRVAYPAPSPPGGQDNQTYIVIIAALLFMVFLLLLVVAVLTLKKKD